MQLKLYGYDIPTEHACFRYFNSFGLCFSTCFQVLHLSPVAGQPNCKSVAWAEEMVPHLGSDFTENHHSCFIPKDMENVRCYNMTCYVSHNQLDFPTCCPMQRFCESIRLSSQATVSPRCRKKRFLYGQWLFDKGTESNLVPVAFGRTHQSCSFSSQRDIQYQRKDLKIHPQSFICTI